MFYYNNYSITVNVTFRENRDIFSQHIHASGFCQKHWDNRRGSAINTCSAKSSKWKHRNHESRCWRKLEFVNFLTNEFFLNNRESNYVWRLGFKAEQGTTTLYKISIRSIIHSTLDSTRTFFWKTFIWTKLISVFKNSKRIFTRTIRVPYATEWTNFEYISKINKVQNINFQFTFPQITLYDALCDLEGWFSLLLNFNWWPGNHGQ